MTAFFLLLRLILHTNKRSYTELLLLLLTVTYVKIKKKSQTTSAATGSGDNFLANLQNN